MRVRIRGGTVNHGDPSLCSSCRHAIVIKGARLREEIVSCGFRWQLQRVSFPVTSCSEYADRALPTLEDMEEIAWALRSSPSGKKVGFVEARRLAERERDVPEE